jgi:ubiquinol-cytochrome c reductase iron-sulfur subunit
MSALGRWLISGAVLLLGRRSGGVESEERDEHRIVARGGSSPGSELVVVLLFLLAAAFAVAFIVVYALDRLPRQTQLLGASLGLAFLCLAAASILIGKRLVVGEELEEEYSPETHPEAQAEVAQIVEESGSRFTRKKLVLGAGGAAGSALALALVTPAVSLGPVFEMGRFYETPWRRGRRLVDEDGKPFRAADIEFDAFYTAFPDGADQEELASPLVVVRLDPRALALPADRGNWAPRGILAYSKICTHAGCAISLYRTPLFAPVEPKPALVCPCHYSTFDPATGGKVLFGPAGRALPQLPLEIDASCGLRAGGNFSGPVGPSWWGVRLKGAKP